MRDGKPVRVLHMTDILSFGSGVSSVILNFIEGLNPEKIRSDVAVTKKGDTALYGKVRSLGGGVFELPPISLSTTGAYKKAFAELLERESYDILHGHVANSGFLYFPIAKKAGVHHRIIHSHNSRGSDAPLKALRNQFLNRNLPKLANHFFACSTEAGEFLFGEKIARNELILFPNAIDTAHFAYQPEIRKNQRMLLGLDENTLAIGHVGRLAVQKNQAFILEAFALLHCAEPNSALYIIGEGDLEEELLRLRETLGLETAVHFLGAQSNVMPFYQAFDQFWMPSLFEGLPVSALEAQAAGLPCLLSDRVSPETNVSGTCAQFSTAGRNAVENWADSALSIGRNFSRQDGARLLRQNGYDLYAEGKKLEQLYVEIAGEIEC